jgi:hypothetical protein
VLLRRPRHHTNRVPKPLRLPRRHVLRALALHCYTSHCTPGSSPYAYKRKVQGPLTEGWPRGEGRDCARVSLSLPPAWTLVNPTASAPDLGTGKHEGRGFPLLRPSPSGFFPPLCSVSRRPIWAGARGDNLLVGPGTPRVRNVDTLGLGYISNANPACSCD